MGTTFIHIIAIALAFGMTVFVHELGHFLLARASGMAVYEFSLGFGRPLLFWLKRGETQYSLRFWPFISYVRIAGMEPGDDHPRGFDKKPRWVQALVIVCGGINNFLLGALIFILLFSVVGIPYQGTNRVEKVLPGSAAAKARLQPGDLLVGLGTGRTELDNVREAIRSHAGRPLALLVERRGRSIEVTVTPQRVKEPTLEERDGKQRIVRVPIGQIGVIFHMKMRRLPIGRAVVSGFQETAGFIALNADYLVGLLRGSRPAEGLAGPVGVVDVLYSEARIGWYSFLRVAALLTIGVGFLNLLPIPALDGSRVLILVIEAIRGRAFDKQKETIVHVVGIALIIALAVALTFKDIRRIWGG